MAKKAKAWDQKPTNFPSRQCPGCGKFYHARSRVCPNCGTANPTRSGVRRVKRRRIVRRRAPTRGAVATRGRGDALDAAIQFIQAAGGIENAKAALDRIERIRGL
jgi:hypothetical protein